jgi:hypothetical protein
MAYTRRRKSQGRFSHLRVAAYVSARLPFSGPPLKTNVRKTCWSRERRRLHLSAVNLAFLHLHKPLISLLQLPINPHCSPALLPPVHRLFYLSRHLPAMPSLPPHVYPWLKPLELSNKSVFITGGASGLGLATVCAAAAYVAIATNAPTYTDTLRFLQTSGSYVSSAM